MVLRRVRWGWEGGRWVSWIVGSGRENSSLYMTVRASILENQSSDMMAELGVIRRGERDHARQNSQTTTFESQQSMNLEGQEGRKDRKEGHKRRRKSRNEIK